MNVADLAKDLEVPPSAVLEACTGLGIEGAWAGAEVSAVDEVRLRARLASAGPVSAGPAGDDPVVGEAPVAEVSPEDAPVAGEVPVSADEPAADPGRVGGAGPVASELEGELVGAAAGSTGTASGSRAGAVKATATETGTGAALPPTAVGSHPGLVEEFSAVEAGRQREDALAGLGRTGPITAPGSGPVAGGPIPTVEADIGRHLDTTVQDRHLDPSIRPATVALVLAVAAAVGGNMLDTAALILPCWLAVAVLLVIAAVSANRARYRITTHPDRRAGLPMAIVVLVVAVLGIATFGGAVWTVVRSAPAADAPLGLGDISSVQHLRWGYQRVSTIADTGWERPSKDVGTCWKAVNPDKPVVRREHRVEQGGARVSCTQSHAFEVVQVISVNHDADAPYPGAASLQATGARRCEAVMGKVAPKGSLAFYEHPDAEGWDAGDHDVACVVMARRSEPLIP
ncbi:MAG: Septum formation [Acidimicrobiales bacterium]|nr:Septum formation [Acidimicrobiales bacterium]